MSTFHARDCTSELDTSSEEWPRIWFEQKSFDGEKIHYSFVLVMAASSHRQEERRKVLAQLVLALDKSFGQLESALIRCTLDQ